MLGLLTGHQLSFVDKFSQLVVKISDNSETSADDELSDWGGRPLDFVNKMIQGDGATNARLLDVFRLKSKYFNRAKK